MRSRQGTYKILFLVLIITILVALFAVGIRHINIKSGVIKDIIQSVPTITAAIGLIMVWYQMKRDRDLNEAEFTINLNQSFSANPGIKDIYSKLDKNMDKLIDPFNEDDIINIAEYLSFFGPIANLLERGILKYELINNLFVFRFFIAVNDPFVQKHMLIKDAEHFKVIYKLYDDWVKFRRHKGMDIPFPEYTLDKMDSNYAEIVRDISRYNK